MRREFPEFPEQHFFHSKESDDHGRVNVVLTVPIVTIYASLVVIVETQGNSPVLGPPGLIQKPTVKKNLEE